MNWKAPKQRTWNIQCPLIHDVTEHWDARQEGLYSPVALGEGGTQPVLLYAGKDKYLMKINTERITTISTCQIRRLAKKRF